MLKKVNSYLKSNYNSIIIFIAILFIIAPVILSKNLSNLDEIWNYNFSRNIANGLIPYKDFNIITTPLLPIIGGVILKLFSNELIIMRFLSILLNSCIFFMVYKILKKLKVNNFYCLFFSFLLFFILKDYICFDYNFAILFLLLILIYLELNNYDINSNKNYLYYFFIGLICGSCILLKQSTGIIIAVASIFYPILFIKNKNDLKIYLKFTAIKTIGILLPIILLFIYLIINNAFYDFIDYTILGMKTFNNYISYSSLLNSDNLIIKMLSIFMPVFILISGFYILIKKERFLYSFFFYSLASLIVIYPISDKIHFLIGIFPFIILFGYLLFKIIKFMAKKLNNKIKYFLYEFIKCMLILLSIIYLIFSCILIKNYLNNPEKNHNINNYKNIPISNNLINKINTIDNYILSQNNGVYILDAEAAIYMIPINKYNKDFDMFNKGNFGSKGEIGQIEKINNLKNGDKILIKNNKYSLNWQTPLEVINYIKNNLNKIGEISIFDIYEIR